MGKTRDEIVDKFGNAVLDVMEQICDSTDLDLADLIDMAYDFIDGTNMDEVKDFIKHMTDDEIDLQDFLSLIFT